jgi:hypothetical protein
MSWTNGPFVSCGSWQMQKFLIRWVDQVVHYSSAAAADKCAQKKQTARGWSVCWRQAAAAWQMRTNIFHSQIGTSSTLAVDYGGNHGETTVNEWVKWSVVSYRSWQMCLRWQSDGLIKLVHLSAASADKYCNCSQILIKNGSNYQSPFSSSTLSQIN